MQEKSVRKSNFELLRIISMLFIVSYHTILHGQALSNSHNFLLTLVFNFIILLSLVHVNSYILVTGYFQSKSRFKQSKVWALINSSLFYRIVIMLIVMILGEKLSQVEILQETFILNLSEYWFIKVYLFLYCLSPFINKLISNLDKKDFQKLLVVLFVILSFLPYITGNKAFSNDGFTLYHFIYLYLIGAYFRDYPIENSRIFKIYSKTCLKTLFIFIIISCVIANYVITQTSISILGNNEIVDEIANNLISNNLSYSNPFVMLQSISYFCFFSMLNIKSKFINGVSKLTLGVYLIHDNQLLKNRIGIYQLLGIGTSPIYSFSYLFYVIVIIIFIFVSGLIIEWVRQKIFKFIYNRNFAIKIREKYYSFINNFRVINIT